MRVFITLFSFIISAFTVLLFPVAYLKEFVKVTIFNGRMTNEKILLRYSSKYVSEFQGALTRSVL